MSFLGEAESGKSTLVHALLGTVLRDVQPRTVVVVLRLCSAYEIPGTDVAYATTPDSTDVGYAPNNVVYAATLGTTKISAGAIAHLHRQSSVQSLKGSLGTELRYLPTRFLAYLPTRACYAMPAISLPACYALRGTDLAYGISPQCPVLT
eukprot:3940677-Rhodomonas_salina.1